MPTTTIPTASTTRHGNVRRVICSTSDRAPGAVDCCVCVLSFTLRTGFIASQRRSAPADPRGGSGVTVPATRSRGHRREPRPNTGVSPERRTRSERSGITTDAARAKAGTPRRASVENVDQHGEPTRMPRRGIPTRQSGFRDPCVRRATTAATSASKLEVAASKSTARCEARSASLVIGPMLPMRGRRAVSASWSARPCAT